MTLDRLPHPMADHEGSDWPITQQNLGEHDFFVGNSTINSNLASADLVGGPGDPLNRTPLKLHTTLLALDIPNCGPYFPGSSGQHGAPVFNHSYRPEASDSHTPSSAETPPGPSTPFNAQHQAVRWNVQSSSTAFTDGMFPSFEAFSPNGMEVKSIAQKLESPLLYSTWHRSLRHASQDIAGLASDEGPTPLFEKTPDLVSAALSNDHAAPPSQLQLKPGHDYWAESHPYPQAFPHRSFEDQLRSPDQYYPDGDLLGSSRTRIDRNENLREPDTMTDPSSAWVPAYDQAILVKEGSPPPPHNVPIPVFTYCDMSMMSPLGFFNPEGSGLRKSDSTSPKIRDASERKRIRPQKFECPICRDRFTSRQNLGNHLNSHTGYSPYECKICDKKYRHSRSFNRHCASAHPQSDTE